MTNVDIHKKAMLNALTKSLGIVSKACDEVGISRQTHYNYMEADPDYKQAVSDIADLAIDFAESKLFEKINGVTVQAGENTYTQPPSDTAIIFYLKTKGKKRGYIEKTEFEHTIPQMTPVIINAESE